MPPILIAFFILLGGATVPPVVKGLVTPPDPSSRPKWGKPAPQEYRTWTSAPWVAVADERTRACDVTFFALATRSRTVRLVAGGEEQLLDWSWSFQRSVPAGERRRIAFDFRDPVGGASLSCQEADVICVHPRGGVMDVRVREESVCAPPPAPVRKAESGKQHLAGKAPAFTPMDLGIGGAYVQVEFELRGTVTEEWYCPAIEVTWPEGTRSSHEEDCAPFPGTAERPGVTKWRFRHGFAPGEWDVKACISKAGKQLACEVVKVRVLGDGSDTPFMGEGR